MNNKEVPENPVDTLVSLVVDRQGLDLTDIDVAHAVAGAMLMLNDCADTMALLSWGLNKSKDNRPYKETRKNFLHGAGPED